MILLNISTKRKVKAGQSGGLTQSRIGSPPFQLDKNNLPINTINNLGLSEEKKHIFLRRTINHE